MSCVSGLRELGKNWAELAALVGSKTAAECKLFYRTERQKRDLDDLVADYHASKAIDVLPTFTAPCGLQGCKNTGCLTLLEILEIYWNNFSLLELYWKLAKSPGNFLADSKFLYFTVYQ